MVDNSKYQLQQRQQLQQQQKKLGDPLEKQARAASPHEQQEYDVPLKEQEWIRLAEDVNVVLEATRYREVRDGVIEVVVGGEEETEKGEAGGEGEVEIKEEAGVKREVEGGGEREGEELRDRATESPTERSPAGAAANETKSLVDVKVCAAFPWSARSTPAVCGCGL